MSRGKIRAMKIGEVARRTGVPTMTIRYYEDIGVMPPPARASNGYRDYRPDAIDRLEFVREAQETGLTLEEISSILELRSHGQATCHHVVDLLERHLEDVDCRIETLRASRDLYSKLIERARTLEPADCTDPNRCQTISAGPARAPTRRQAPTERWQRAASHAKTGTTSREK
jgi:MerR family copper efflux transcriptional regulator